MGEQKEFEFSCGKIQDDWIFADLHIHSRFSRACSKDLNIINLVKWARIKGLGLMGTGDFTHNEWLEEIKSSLKEREGIYWYKDEKGEFPFILTSEISLIYSKNGKGHSVHLVYLAPSIETVNKINAWLDTKGRRDYDGRPIFKISCRDFAAKMEEIDPRIEVIPAHIWTPYFGVFGSESGFNSLEEAFEDKTYLIHAIETGISSDPKLNWKIKDLDNISIVSFSDSHSYWPYRIGREATIFSKEKNGGISYNTIINQIRNKSYIGTIETDPAYGKYHYDGHSKCNFSSSFEDTIKLNGKCPVCGKDLIVGVEYRINELTKNGNANPKNKKCFFSILPLHEIISLSIGVGMNSKGCWNIYNSLIDKFGNEFNVLLTVSSEEIMNVTQNELLTKLIIRNRNGEIKVKPGYDGLYGVAILDDLDIIKKNFKKEVSIVKNSKMKKDLEKIKINQEKEYIASDKYDNTGNYKYEKQKKLF
jgi:uncharacterized protein (TIGR00375 family)